MYWRTSTEIKIVIKNPDGNIKFWMYTKTNISKNGKVYPQKPSWRWIEDGYYNHLLTRQRIIDEDIDKPNYYQLRNLQFPFVRSEWELEEIH